MHFWHDRINQIIPDNPTWSENGITWKLIEEMAVRGARMLGPTYERCRGKKGGHPVLSSAAG